MPGAGRDRQRQEMAALLRVCRFTALFPVGRSFGTCLADIMNPLKSLLKSALCLCGYELRKTSQFGLDAIRDMRQILGVAGKQTIFDVGAHEGETAVPYAENFPGATIHSFEPFPRAFGRLQSDVSRFANVKPVNLALGDKLEERLLHVNRSSPTNSILTASPQVGDGATLQLMTPVEQIPVQVVTLDAYCRDQNVSFIDLLKMDVQGYELHVLRGARRLLA